MAKVVRRIEFNEEKDLLNFLEKEYNISLDLGKEDNCEFKNQELDSVLVNLSVSKEKDKSVLTISKLVSLKAFLLGKEEGMDVLNLIKTIDKVMNMSSNGVKTNDVGIVHDENIKEFLNKASIQIESNTDGKVILADNKRKASVEYLENTFDFNTIEEL